MEEKMKKICSLLAAVLVCGLVLCSFGCSDKKEPEPDRTEKKTAEGAPDIYNVEVSDSATRGPDTALVTVIAFSDFQCPFSKRSADSMEQLLKEYNGKLRYVFKHYPLGFHKWAKQASYAAVAAGKQGKFWEYYAKLYTDVRNINEELIVRYAEELRLNMDKFNADRKSNETVERVKKDIALGENFGVRGTPTLFINGTRMVGANSVKLKASIAEHLADAEKIRAGGVNDVYNEIVKHGKTQFKPSKREPQAVSTDVYKAQIPENAPMWGAQDAPVTMILIDDFECPFCGKLYSTYEELKKEYAGKIRIFFVHNPLGFHKRAKEASAAAVAAQNQGKFWEMYSLLFSKQREWTKDPDFTKWLENEAKVLSLDIEKYNADKSSSKTEELIASNIKYAAGLGAMSTPATFINGRFIGGALPIVMIKTVIDEELARANELSSKTGLKGDGLYNEIIKDGKPAVIRSNRSVNDTKREDPNKIYDVVLTGNEPVKGDPNGKVTIVGFSDFQCPHCQRAFQTFGEVLPEYKKGVKLVFKHFPLFSHDKAKPAALFTIAAKKLYGDAKFYELAALLFDKQQEWKTNPNEKFEQYAKQLKLDWSKIDAEIKTGNPESILKADLDAAAKLGLRSVPLFFINGKKVSGAKPKEFIKSKIDELLKSGK